MSSVTSSDSTGGRARLNDGQQLVDAGAIVRILAGMREGHPAFRINQDIPSQLMPVLARFSGTLASQDQLQILENRTGIVKVPPAAPIHAVSLVGSEVRIEQERPGKPGFMDIVLCHRVSVESDHQQLQAQLGQFRFALSQLRQVMAAGRSSQMAVKHQQQPSP